MWRAVVASLCLSLVTLCVAAEDSDQRFLAGLRQRRLFALAESYCRRRLADQELSEIERSDLTVDWIRVLTERALNSAADNRDAIWQQAHDVAADFTTQYPAHVRGVLVRVQAALAVVAYGELSRLESEVTSQPEAALHAARDRLQEAAKLLQTIDHELTEAIPIRRRNPLRPDELSADELATLQQHVRRHLSRAYQNEALCFPPASADRLALLNLAMEQLRQPLVQVPPDDPLGIEVRLEQIIDSRLLGDLETARGYLEQLVALDLRPEDKLRVRAEAIRVHLAGGEFESAAADVVKGRLPNESSPDLDFAFLESYVHLWKQAADAKNSEQAATWRDKSVAAAKFIEQTHGAYWSRRAELLLVRVGQGSGDGSIEILRRSADDLYRQGKLADAIAAYDKASAAAQASDSSLAFELAYKAALVEQQLKQFSAAASRFRAAASAHPRERHAANAHLLAIVCLRQASAAEGEWRPEYVEVLREHLKQWPDSETASMAAFWLGELQAGQDAWQSAMEAFRLVKASSPQYAPAVKSLGVCWLRRLDQLRQAGQPTTDQVAQASAFFSALVRDGDGNLLKAWPPVSRDAATALARIDLSYRETELSQTRLILEAAIAGSPPPDQAWRMTATALLVTLLARQPGGQVEARKLLSQLSETSPDELLELFQRLAQDIKALPLELQPESAAIQLEVADLLRTHLDQLNPSQQVMLERTRAEALATAGRLPEAIAAYRELARQHPDDGAIQEGLGELLLRDNQIESGRQALDQWRRIAARSQPRSERWFRAKYSIVQAQLRLNDKAEAAKLIHYLQATEDLQQNGWAAKFDALLKQCEE